MFFWNRPPVGESDVRAAHAPFSESGFSAPVKSDDAIGPAAIAVIGMSIAMSRAPTTPPVIRNASFPRLTRCSSRSRGERSAKLGVTCHARRYGRKLAWTALALVTFTVQVVPEAVSQPSHPLKIARTSGATVSVTTVPKSNETEHVGPQLIWVALAGLEVDVTVPLPTPKGLDLVTVTRNLCSVNVAVTDRAPLTVAVQTAPETESHPTQLVKLDPVAGVAVSVTTVPSGYELEQVVPQLICVGLEGLEVDVMVPPPLPAFFADRVAVTVKLLALVAVPPSVVTPIGPVAAPEGTVAWIVVAEVTV